MSERLQVLVVATVVTVWAALTIGSFVSPGHSVPTTVDTIMGIVAGGAVANEVVKRAVKNSPGSNGNGDGAKKAEQVSKQGSEIGRSLMEDALERGRAKRNDEKGKT